MSYRVKVNNCASRPAACLHELTGLVRRSVGRLCYCSQTAIGLVRQLSKFAWSLAGGVGTCCMVDRTTGANEGGLGFESWLLNSINKIKQCQAFGGECRRRFSYTRIEYTHALIYSRVALQVGQLLAGDSSSF